MSELMNDELETVNLESFTHAKGKVTSRTANFERHKGLSIVNARTGKRLILNSDEILSKLTHNETVQIAFSDTEIIIANYLKNDNSDYLVKKSGKNGAVYNADLVRTLTSHFNLDFSDRTSMTFPVSSIKKNAHGIVLVVNITSEINEALSGDSIESITVENSDDLAENTSFENELDQDFANVTNKLNAEVHDTHHE